MGDFNKVEYVNNYNRANYKDIKMRVRPEQRDIIEKHITRKGYSSLNAYLVDLVANDMIGEEYYDDFIKTIRR